MNLNELNFSGKTRAGNGNVTFQAVNPAARDKFAPDYFEATTDKINEAALKAAHRAFQKYRNKSGKEKAILLETIAEEITALGDDLIKRCCNETDLPEARIIRERGRTISQLNLFAQLLREGSSIDARLILLFPNAKRFQNLILEGCKNRLEQPEYLVQAISRWHFQLLAEIPFRPCRRDERSSSKLILPIRVLVK